MILKWGGRFRVDRPTRCLSCLRKYCPCCFWKTFRIPNYRWFSTQNLRWISKIPESPRSQHHQNQEILQILDFQNPGIWNVGGAKGVRLLKLWSVVFARSVPCYFWKSSKFQNHDRFRPERFDFGSPTHQILKIERHRWYRDILDFHKDYDFEMRWSFSGG